VVQVAVCGPAECSAREAEIAERVGELLAERGAVVLCGGGGGVMAAVARGARSRGGLVVGIRPDGGGGGASVPPDLSAVVFTGMGQARNAVIVTSADAVIAVGGSWGTLSEIALAKRRGGVPVVCVDGWRVTDRQGGEVAGLVHVTSPEEAVTVALGAQS
jgi:uncharacterized protein (TIGR00725 family)